MKFSLIYEAQTAVNSREADRQLFDDIIEQALLAERLGFDVIWAVEHTALTHYAHMSAPKHSWRSSPGLQLALAAGMGSSACRHT